MKIPRFHRHEDDAPQTRAEEAELNPLVVLIVTLGAGALFGMVGLVLAAPLTSAGVHISADLARAKVEVVQTAKADAEPVAAPG